MIGTMCNFARWSVDAASGTFIAAHYKAYTAFALFLFHNSLLIYTLADIYYFHY